MHLDIGNCEPGEKIWLPLYSFTPRCYFSIFANILIEQMHRYQDSALLVKCLPCYLHDGLYRNAKLYILIANKKMLLKDFFVCESCFSSPEFWDSFEKS